MWLYAISSPGIGLVYAFQFESNARALANRTLSYYTISRVWLPKHQLKKWLSKKGLVLNHVRSGKIRHRAKILPRGRARMTYRKL